MLLHAKQSLASCDRVRCSFVGWEWTRLGMGSPPGTAFGTFSTARPVKREKKQDPGTPAADRFHWQRQVKAQRNEHPSMHDRVVRFGIDQGALRCVLACVPARCRGGALPHEQTSSQKWPRLRTCIHQLPALVPTPTATRATFYHHPICMDTPTDP